jgi:hypothetical protein
MSLLLAAGVPVPAINAANESALQLACTYCDLEKVQLLLHAGGWLTSNGFKCQAGATRAGNAEVLELLLCAATATAAATTASDSGSSGSSSGHMCCIQATTATSDLNLLHVAAAVRSLSCAELLVRHGVDATAVSKATSAEQRSRLSPLDLLLYDLSFLHFDELQLPPDVEATNLEPGDFDKFALMLLSCGATVNPKCVFRKLTEQFAIAQQKHTVNDNSSRSAVEHV